MEHKEIHPSQGDLFKPVEKELFKKPEERVVHSTLPLERILQTTKPINSLEAYGLTEENLNYFHTNVPGNYKAAKYLFYGMHNFERDGIGVPSQVYQSLPTGTIAAMFIGDAELKSSPSLSAKGKSKRIYRYSELKDKSTEEIIPALVDVGFKYNAVRELYKNGYKPNKKENLKEIIGALPENVRKMFELAFKRPRAKPYHENKEGGFYDPNFDASLSQKTARIYTRLVAAFMKSCY